MEAQGAFVTLVNESKQAQELNERYREMQQLKSAILERDRQSTEHGNFVAMKNEAQAAQELAARERELSDLRNAIVRRNDEMIAAENRLREATERTNQARREAISVSRKQAESLVRDRVKELEAQRNAKSRCMERCRHLSDSFNSAVCGVGVPTRLAGYFLLDMYFKNLN